MKLLIVAALLFSPVAVNADYTCTGKVQNLNQNRAGHVSLISSEIYGGNGSGRRVCSLIENWKGVSPEVCQAWLSKLLMAKASGTPIKVQYVDDASCATQPTWSDAHAPYAFWEAK